jgi:hypothetical protein
MRSAKANSRASNAEPTSFPNHPAANSASTAGNNQVSTSAACTSCREKHLKCDGLEKCTRCAAQAIPCVYLKSRRGHRGRKVYNIKAKGESLRTEEYYLANPKK